MFRTRASKFYFWAKREKGAYIEEKVSPSCQEHQREVAENVQREDLVSFGGVEGVESLLGEELVQQIDKVQCHTHEEANAGPQNPFQQFALFIHYFQSLEENKVENSSQKE